MTRTYNNLYPRVTSFANLYSAWQKAARGKRGRVGSAHDAPHGRPPHSPASAFEFDLEHNLLQLERELRERTYRPGPYGSFYVRDPKRRLVSAAPFRDRVVHHALCNVIEPLFESSFIGDSYGNRVGKGTHRALDRAQAFARRYRFVLQCNVRQFFPSVDLGCLRAMLARRIADPGVLWLIDVTLENGAEVLKDEYTMVYFPGDDLFAVNRPRGLPIGNLTSQFWANVYLDDLDQFVKRRLRCPAYLRFVDDSCCSATTRAGSGNGSG